MSQKDLMRKLQKENVLTTIVDIRELVQDCSNQKRYEKEILTLLDNMTDLVNSYDGNFEKKPILSRISHACSVTSDAKFGAPLDNNQKKVIRMILDELEQIFKNENSAEA